MMGGSLLNSNLMKVMGHRSLKPGAGRMLNAKAPLAHCLGSRQKRLRLLQEHALPRPAVMMQPKPCRSMCLESIMCHPCSKWQQRSCGLGWLWAQAYQEAEA